MHTMAWVLSYLFMQNRGSVVNVSNYNFKRVSMRRAKHSTFANHKSEQKLA